MDWRTYIHADSAILLGIPYLDISEQEVPEELLAVREPPTRADL